MPLYCYKCPSCGETCEKFRPMADSDKGVQCSPCGCRMERDRRAEVLAPGETRDYPEDWRSSSLGVDPSQLAEARAAAPGVRFCDRTGDVLARNAQERKRAIRIIGKPLGMRDLDSYDG